MQNEGGGETECVCMWTGTCLLILQGCRQQDLSAAAEVSNEKKHQPQKRARPSIWSSFPSDAAPFVKEGFHQLLSRISKKSYNHLTAAAAAAAAVAAACMRSSLLALLRLWLLLSQW